MNENSSEILSKMRERILENTELTVYVTDLETNKILYANKSLVNMYGGNKLTGCICWEALHNGNKRCEFCRIPYLIKNPGKSYAGQVECDNSGKRIFTHNSLIPWPNGPGKLAHLSFNADITSLNERKNVVDYYMYWGEELW